MKRRLQKLWDDVTPYGGCCPEPDMEKIRRRVDAALDGRPRAVSRRRLKLAIMAAAAVLLLTGTALAGEELIPPEFNVLNTFFYRGTNPDSAIAMMNITPVSVEDDNYTMTVTSSLADGNKVYFTIIVEPKNDKARERLREAEVADLLSFLIPGSSARGIFSGYDAEINAAWIDVSSSWRPTKNVSVRFDLMDQGIWLDFPVKTVRSLTLKIDAEVQDIGSPVTVDRVEISPLSYMLRFTAPDLFSCPIPYFLFKDGSILTMSQMKVTGPSGGSATGLFDQYPGRMKYSWQFGSVQDLSLM